jgi:hypothetical protein
MNFKLLNKYENVWKWNPMSNIADTKVSHGQYPELIQPNSQPISKYPIHYHPATSFPHFQMVNLQEDPQWNARFSHQS